MLNDGLKRDLNAILPMLGEYLVDGTESGFNLCCGLLERTLTPSKIAEKAFAVCVKYVQVDADGSTISVLLAAQRLMEKMKLLDFNRLNTVGRA